LPDKISNTPILIRYSDGGGFWVLSRSVSEYLLDTTFLRFFLVATLIFAILADPSVPEKMSAAKIAVMWLAISCAVLVWLTISLRVSKWMIDTGVLQAIYTPILIFPVPFITDAVSHTYIGLVHLPRWSGYQPDLTDLLTSFFAVICFDIFHGRFVAPLHPLVISARTPEPDSLDAAPKQHEMQPGVVDASSPSSPLDGSDGPADTAKAGDLTSAIEVPLDAVPVKASLPERVMIGTSEFNPRRIKLIRSEEHYLSIDTDKGTKLLRAKMSDAATTLGLSFGLQISRSLWVAYAEVEAIKNAGGKLELELKNGEVLTVPRARKQAFLQAYDLFSTHTKDSAET